MPELNAPGWPGIAARWTSSAKTGVGTSLGVASHTWFTISHGILNEIYYPRIDQVCTRDMGLIVTDGKGFFSEEKRHTQHRLEALSEGVPGYRYTNTCKLGRYRIEKEIVIDPSRDVVLQKIKFVPLQGRLEDYRLHALIAPHLGNQGAGNTGWIGDYKGIEMLFAQRENIALVLACSVPWVNRSVGFVGYSDGWQDLKKHSVMTWRFDRAENGNIALTGEVDLRESRGEFVLAIGFGRTSMEAGNRASSSLFDGFDAAKVAYLAEWSDWQEKIPFSQKLDGKGRKAFQISMAVLRAHESAEFPGGLIASLSIPWGGTRGDNDLGGYHLVWPRDLVESAGGLLAAGSNHDAYRVLHYLRTVQESDGHWPQNMWLDGKPYWNGVQMDEAAFPILLIDLAHREGTLNTGDCKRFWPTLRKAAAYIVRNGPVTQQDRWEEDSGYSPFTLAVEISALLVAADLAEHNNEPELGVYLRETADAWNASVEKWMYVRETELARKVGVDGYYVRIAPPETADACSPAGGFVPIKNRPIERGGTLAEAMVSPDALALVRFGLRSPHDPRIVNTVKVIDAILKVDTPFGPAWHRYNEDGYGEHENGSAFDGSGIGRLWPLLVGERAHYELAAGRADEAQRLLKTMESFANEGGMIPEQVWDSSDIPSRELFIGRPTGSAMPLVWAHSEHIKLLRSLRDGRVFDTAPQTLKRYAQSERFPGTPAIWRFNHKCRMLEPGTSLRIEVLSQAIVHWSVDGWRTIQDSPTRDTGIGIHLVDIASITGSINFTFYWPDADRWEGRDFEVRVVTPTSGTVQHSPS